jgi:hypothetical protein
MIFSGQYNQVPIGAAIVLLIATPILGGDPGWPFLAAAVIAAVLGIPILLRGRSLA